jgi:hypothetical protein
MAWRHARPRPPPNILGISAPRQFSDVILDIAAGTVEAFVEHRGLSPHHFPKRPKSVVRKVQHGI